MIPFDLTWDRFQELYPTPLHSIRLYSLFAFGLIFNSFFFTYLFSHWIFNLNLSVSTKYHKQLFLLVFVADSYPFLLSLHICGIKCGEIELKKIANRKKVPKTKSYCLVKRDEAEWYSAQTFQYSKPFFPSCKTFTNWNYNGCIFLFIYYMNVFVVFALSCKSHVCQCLFSHFQDVVCSWKFIRNFYQLMRHELKTSSFVFDKKRQTTKDDKKKEKKKVK